MDKKILSTSLSLACHTIFLIIAFNLILTPQSLSEPVAPPVLIHVHLEARPFSPSMGVQMPKPMPPQRFSHTPQMKRGAPIKPRHHKQATPRKAPAKSATVPKEKPKVSNDNIISVIKPHVKTHHAPAVPNKRKSLTETKEAIKNVKEKERKVDTSAVMPLADVSTEMEQAEIKPSLQPQLENFQGETPYLPFEQNGNGTDIQSYLGYELYTYEDPDDHVKYFRLSIKVEEMPGSLPILPKEMNFLIDASGSIGQEPLDQVKQGVEKALTELDGNDKFNVMVFNQSVHKMEGEAAPNNTATVQEADEFLSDVRAVSTTDLYDTVYKTVQETHTMKPAYIMLISDGQPTQGITDSLQLINKIGEADQGRVPIFGLGIGWANEYLMNFLAFTNHGWSEFVPLNIENSLLELFDHIKDPVLTNLRYYSVGLDKNEIYPKRLPDLFKDSEFVLYGRYTDEDKFLFQLRGDSLTESKQYMISDRLSNGQPGDRTIAQEWAMRKIYDLIGKLQYDQNNQTIIDEINGLATKFDLKIPQYQANNPAQK